MRRTLCALAPLAVLLLFVCILSLPASARAGTPVPPPTEPPPAEPSILNDSEEPGSVLIFHRFIRGTVPPTGDLPATEISISVTCPNGSVCAGEPVLLRAHWVCPGDEGPVCHETKFDRETTVKGTVSIRPDGNPQGENPPCREGYLIVWVIDHDGNPIKFDGLIGHAVIRHSFVNDDVGPSAISEGAYNALPIQAAAHLNTGDFTDRNGNNDGKLDFDGTEYKAITGTIYGTVSYEKLGILPQIQTSLTLLTLDVASNQPNDPTHVEFNFFNEEEHLRPSSLDFTCWTRVRLTAIDSGLDTNFGRTGLVESTSATQAGHPVTLVGIVSTITFSEIPVAPGTCQIPRTACTVTEGFCEVVDASCTPNLPSRDAVCNTGADTSPCRVPSSLFCMVCLQTYDFIVPLAGCAPIVGRCQEVASTCEVTEGACSVVGAMTSVPALSEYSYSLFNDSKAVATTYDPFDHF